MNKKATSFIRVTFLLPAVAILIVGAAGSGASPARAEGLTYVGTEQCRDCHEKEYDSFKKHTDKADSFASVTIMKKGLTGQEYRECLECHTTGYGKPGGFVSEESTPDLKNAGCEVCHGPGSAHVESEDPDDIKGVLTVEDCTGCHNADRVPAFNFKPLIYGGAH